MYESQVDRKIAVIAIHGVGDHEPFQSARAVAGLLSNLRQESGSSQYSALEEKVVRISVRPTETEQRTEALRQEGTWGPMDAVASSILRTPTALPESKVRSLSHQFMDGQLARAKDHGADSPYPTLRVDTVRQA